MDVVERINVKKPVSDFRVTEQRFSGGIKRLDQRQPFWAKLKDRSWSEGETMLTPQYNFIRIYYDSIRHPVHVRAGNRNDVSRPSHL